MAKLDAEQLQKLRYPIGKFDWGVKPDPEKLRGWINTIEQFPGKLELLVKELNESQLDTTYRPGGWTIRQVVHHVADSHMNSYIRYKWTLTEDKPVIKAYYEDRWAEGTDYRAGTASALNLLKALHEKWVYLLKNLSEEEWKRSFIHPETNREITLDKLTGMYAWHCDHHYAHIAGVNY